MSIAFNAVEVLTMAEQIERNGAAFYREAAGRVDDAAAKELLLGFAAMEDDHLKTFSAMKAELSQAETKGVTFDPEGEAGLYLEALAATKVFHQKDIDTSRLEGIFTAALVAEKDSILFYVGMKDLVPESLGSGRVDGIIREEMRHIRILGEQLAAL